MTRPASPRCYRVRFMEMTCYAIEVEAENDVAAIMAAPDVFFGMGLVERADALEDGGGLDYFEAEEVTP